MAKKYETDGRTIHNYRGRYGRLTLVPSPKSSRLYTACDTYGIACRVLEADFDSSVKSVGTEPVVESQGLPAGKLHLDVVETLDSGEQRQVEVKAKEFLTPEALHRLSIAQEALSRSGTTLEVSLRDDVVERVHRQGLPFLYRFKQRWQPQSEQSAIALSLCRSAEVLRRSEWILRFKGAQLTPMLVYWAIAHEHLKLVGDAALFPDGQLAGNVP